MDIANYTGISSQELHSTQMRFRQLRKSETGRAVLQMKSIPTDSPVLNSSPERINRNRTIQTEKAIFINTYVY